METLNNFSIKNELQEVHVCSASERFGMTELSEQLISCAKSILFDESLLPNELLASHREQKSKPVLGNNCLASRGYLSKEVLCETINNKEESIFYSFSLKLLAVVSTACLFLAALSFIGAVSISSLTGGGA